MYAIVPSPGCYGSGSTVRPLAILSDLPRALKRAQTATRAYRRGMPGYTSGGYRVVECAGTDRRSVSWLGWELDRQPSL